MGAVPRPRSGLGRLEPELELPCFTRLFPLLFTRFTTPRHVLRTLLL